MDDFTQNIARAENVVVVCTPQYKWKANNVIGSGVYEEMQIIQRELESGGKDDKFIPLIREGTVETSVPKCLTSRLYKECLVAEDRPGALKEIARTALQIPNGVDLFGDTSIIRDLFRL